MFLILGVALLRGCLYAAILPPWQHYDEPAHFEYVRLLAERGRLPRTGDYDLEMRREIAASMQAAGFWKGMVAPKVDPESIDPPPIGVSALSHPPLYYALLALPQLLVPNRDIETQLAVARLCSVLLGLVVAASAYAFASELLPQRPWMGAAVAAFVALLPPFADLMSAVNNDAGAAAASALFLVAAARLVRRGPTLTRAAGLVGLAGVCALTKSTSGLLAASVLAVLALSYIPRRFRAVAWAGGALLAGAVVVVALDWRGQAAHWYNVDRPGAEHRGATQAVLGGSALVLADRGDSHPRAVFQELDCHTADRLRGQTVALGAWLRSAGGDGFAALNLDDGLSNHWHRVAVTSEWAFYAYTATVGVDAPGVAVQVLLADREPAPSAYADAVVLVDSAMPAGAVPQFDTGRAASGRWGEERFTNLIRNPSAEAAWPGLRGPLARSALLRLSPALGFQSLLDWRRTAWVYPQVAWLLFTSFWGGFGWNHLSLPGPLFYPLALVTLAAVGGAGHALWRAGGGRGSARPDGGRGAVERRRARALVAAALLAGWGSALLRVHPVFATREVFWPVARYAFVAVLPTALLLCAGLAHLVPPRQTRAAAWAGLVALVALDAVALWAVIVPYYYGGS